MPIVVGGLLVGGTVTFFVSSSVLAISSASVATAAARPDALVDVAGVAKGTATITVNGRSAGGRHDSETVSVTVV